MLENYRRSVIFLSDMKTWCKQGGLPERMCGMDGNNKGFRA